METSILVPLMVTHFIADFVAQDDRMAKNKSTDFGWLTFHCVIYALCFSWTLNMEFVFIIFAVHFVTDFFTSKITSKLYKAKEYHYFFVVIGFDQLLHFLQIYYISQLL